jgi:hypothetical protein
VRKQREFIYYSPKGNGLVVRHFKRKEFFVIHSERGVIGHFFYVGEL